MKQRSGFVSNSSTTSFIIDGLSYPQDKVTACMDAIIISLKKFGLINKSDGKIYHVYDKNHPEQQSILKAWSALCEVGSTDSLYVITSARAFSMTDCLEGFLEEICLYSYKH
ncbi:MAG: hypothetical protein WC942_06825 [Clostridia bacterium]|jgi:hypothetical protein